MSRKILLSLFLIVVLPLSVLGWLGFKVSTQDREQVRNNIRNLLRGRLQDTQSQVHKILQQLERTLIKELDNRQGTLKKLRNYQDTEPLVRQVFWLDTQNNLLYPRPSGVLSTSEQNFLTRTRHIWEGKTTLPLPKRSHTSRPTNSNPDPQFYGAPLQPNQRKRRYANNKQQQTSANSPPRPYANQISPQQQNARTRGYFRKLPVYGSQQRLSPQPSSNAMGWTNNRSLTNNNDKDNLNKDNNLNGSPRQQHTQPQKSPTLQRSVQGSTAQQKRRPNRPQDQTNKMGHSWLAWYWAEGLHLMFWKRTRGGQIVGVEIDRIVLMSQLIQELPTTTQLKGRVQLRDERDALIHQWGSYEVPKGEKPLAQLQLPHPLYAWSLHYYGPEKEELNAFTGQLYLNLALMLSFVALGLLALAFYLYREYSRDLREASLKVNFVTQVSHELKTPLTNIRLYAELLENRLPDDDPKSQRYTHVIVTESQRLSRLITNILTYSKQQKETLSLRRREVDLDEVIEQTLEQFTPTLEARGFEIERALGEGGLVLGDPDAIAQILGNLLSNVEKYAPDGRWVKIESGRVDEQTSYFEVSDRGPGIPATIKHKIFQPFFRGSDRLSDGVTGTGIGLSIAQDLARLQKGALLVSSNTEGSRFRLTLPMCPIHKEES